MRLKKSIRLRYTVIFALILGTAIALSVFMNNVLLEKYYIVDKTNTMIGAYDAIREITRDGIVINDQEDDIVIKNNQHLFPIDKKEDEAGAEESETETSSANSDKSDNKSNKLIYYLNGIQSESNITALVINGENVVTAKGQDSSWLMRLYVEMQMGKTMAGEVDVLEETDNYSVVKVYDRNMEAYYLVVTGKLECEGYCYMRTPLLGISESVGVSNRFYIYVGIGSLILGTILMYVVMGLVTKPIVSLTNLSKKMSQLDFDAKYNGNYEDEIGELGQHMNEMSEKLESTIASLKTANIELQNDIEAKNSIARERSEFVANVSHELKTPIALIQGYAEGLMDGVADDPESMAFYCEVISDEAGKMNRMVKRLLTLNQLEFGSEKLEMSRFDINQLIKGLVDSSSILARQKDTVIVFSPDGPIYIWADEYRIEEVISNYLSNALHYVSGKNIVEIKSEKCDGLCRVSVYNSGSHIPDDDIDKVWEKFYKVDKARTREYGGNGIGLSIVKAIMDVHGGRCYAKNTDDGVVFVAEFPME